MNDLSLRKKDPPIVHNTALKKQQKRKPKIRSKISFPLIATILIIIMGAVAIYLWNGIIWNGAKALIDSYNTAFDSEKDAAYQTQYQKYFDKAEAAYHVKNRVSISIGDLQKEAALEVLQVSDIEYIIESRKDNSNNITSWLEVPGQGTYVVDLEAAEFLVDDERSYVLVRAPYPELRNISIDYANVKKMLFENNIFNDSYRVGEDLARQQLNAADLLIKKEFSSNQYFYLNAQEAAISTIQCLIKQLNPGVDELEVDVEFY